MNMKRILFIAVVFIAFINCGTGSLDSKKDSSAIFSDQSDLKKDNVTQDTLIVQNWLSTVIMDYLNGDDLKAAYNGMRSALTNDYYNYKQDAINLEYGDEMTVEEFHDKWSEKYDTKYVGGGGFFYPYQDHGKIEITSCILKTTLGDTAQIYRVLMHDTHWNSDEIIDVRVVTSGQKNKIDDIKHMIKK